MIGPDRIGAARPLHSTRKEKSLFWMAFVAVHAAAAAAMDRFRSLVVLRAVSLHRESEREKRN